MTPRFLSALFLASALLLPAHAQDYDAQVTALLPRLADATVANRYAAQMELQALASKSSQPGNADAREALGKVLAAKAADATVAQPARVWIVRQLQYMGGAEAVPSLTQLLPGDDAELRECARRALEQNPAPAANSSLLAALSSAKELTWQLGLIHSLGQRRDPASVPALTPFLREAATAAVAAEALGNVAAPAAVTALQSAPATPATADALLAAARRSAPANAAGIYEQVFTAGKDLPARAAALRGLARSAPETFAKLAPSAVASADSRLVNAALDGCALAPTGADWLAKLLPELPPATRIQALNTVETWDFGRLRELTKDADAGVRAAAFGALARLGQPEAVLLLVKLAARGEAADRAAAQNALNTVRTAAALVELRPAAAKGDPAERVAALNALAARRDTGSLAMFVTALRDPETAVRRPALNGLRQMGGGEEMEAVARFAVATGSPEAGEALAAMATRVKDRATAADQLLAAANGHPDHLALLADALAALGGKPALEAISTLAQNGKADTREAALAALGNWADLTAAPALQQAIAESNANPKLQSLALAALARLVRGAEAAELAQREAAILPALASARQPADRKLILSAMATVPTAAVGEALRPLLADPAVRNEAALAAITVAEGMRKTDLAGARALAQAVKASAANRDAVSRAERLLR